MLHFLTVIFLCAVKIYVEGDNIFLILCIFVGFPGSSPGKEPACQCRRRT